MIYKFESKSTKYEGLMTRDSAYNLYLDIRRNKTMLNWKEYLSKCRRSGKYIKYSILFRWFKSFNKDFELKVKCGVTKVMIIINHLMT